MSVAVGGDRRERDGRLFAGLLGDAPGMVLLQPFACRDEAGERLGQLGDEPLPGRRRQVVAGEHRFAHGGEMAEAGDDPIERERRDLGLGILDQHQAGLGRSHLGDRSRDGARQRRAVGDGGLRLRTAGGDRIDQVGVDQQRRIFQHPARHLRLVGGKPQDHRRGRELAERERLGQRGAHQRRRIVELHDERALGSGAVVRREIGIEVSARQGGGGVAPLGGWCGAHPVQELTNDHVATDAMMGWLAALSVRPMLCSLAPEA
jgi:hypothetical protein